MYIFRVLFYLTQSHVSDENAPNRILATNIAFAVTADRSMQKSVLFGVYFIWLILDRFRLIPLSYVIPLRLERDSKSLRVLSLGTV